MHYGFVTEVLENILTVRFCRPEIRSPLSIPVVESLTSIFKDDKALAEMRAIIFTGIDDVFASGADLKEIVEVEPKAAREFSQRGQTLMNMIACARPNTIAAINGYCFGGALDLALACDRRIASPGALFSHPGVGLGIITGWGGTQRLPRLVGQANALELFFTAKRIAAAEALRIGLVDRMADDAYAEAVTIALDS